MTEKEVPVWAKYTLTVAEASAYFGIGESKLRRLVSENVDADYVLKNGAKLLIKRKLFEEVLDQATSI